MDANRKIIPRYSFNVPLYKTFHQKVIGGRGGRCSRNCTKCPAHQRQCQGCSGPEVIACPDGRCPATECARCAVLCHRGGPRLVEAMSIIDGLEIDMKISRDTPLAFSGPYYPSLHRPLSPGVANNAQAFSVPWHVFYDFHADQPLTTDLRGYFRIPETAKLIVNSYMKDDKVLCLFEKMANHSFIPLLRQFIGVDYWHTPCFSVFNRSSKMDQALNFKRQFWAGDIMRDAGINTIQEVLYTHENRNRVAAGWDHAIEIISRKQIKKISQCGQLDNGSSIESDRRFYQSLPQDTTLIITGLSGQLRDEVAGTRCRVVFSDYVVQYNGKKYADFIEQITTGGHGYGR